MRPSKILLVCPAGLVSGKEIVSLTLARGLRNEGFDLEIVTSSWGSDEFARRLAEEGFKYHRLRLGYISASLRWHLLDMTLAQLLYWPVLLYQYFRLVHPLAPAAVIHTNWHHALLLLPLLNPQRDIYWAHEIIPSGHKSGWIFRLIARRVAKIVCVSHAVRDSFAAAGVPSQKLSVIHNGIPLVSIAPPLRSEGPLRLGIVGQIGAWKGHDDLLAAFAIALAGGAEVVLKIFGAGNVDYIKALKQKVSNLGISDSVEWCGFVHDQEAIFRSVDVCVVPSRFIEPFGMSAVEANGFGRPVICSARGGLAEIVQHGVSGIIVDPESPAQLAHAIRGFADDRQLIAKMGEAARRRAESEFSQRRFAEKFIQLIADDGAQHVRTGLRPDA